MKYPVQSLEVSGSPGIGVPDGRELPCGYWEPNLGPLQKHMLLIHEPLLRPSKHTLNPSFILPGDSRLSFSLWSLIQATSTLTVGAPCFTEKS